MFVLTSKIDTVAQNFKVLRKKQTNNTNFEISKQKI